MKSIFKSKKVMIAFTIIVLVVITIVTSAAVLSAGDEKKIKDKLELGEKYLTEMQYEEAIVVFEEVIAIEPRCMEAYIGLADAYLGLEKPDKAIESLERGITVVKQTKEEKGKIIDKSDELYIKEAKILIDLGKPEEAIEKLEEGYEITGSEQIKVMLQKYCPAVETSLPERKYEEEKNVELTSTGIHIYYTTDGSEPTKESNLYEEQIPLEKGEMNIKAVAESEYGTFGEVRSFKYTLNLPAPVLSEDEKALLDSLCQSLQDTDYDKVNEIMCRDNYIALIAKTENRIPYYYDGTKASDKIDGVGLKIVSDTIVYYGNLSQGEEIENGSYFKVMDQTGDPVYYHYYQGELKDRKPNGNGVYGQILKSNITERKNYFSAITEGEFENGLQNGNMKLSVLDDTEEDIFYYTMDNGKIQVGDTVKYDEKDNVYMVTSSDGDHTWHTPGDRLLEGDDSFKLNPCR